MAGGLVKASRSATVSVGRWTLGVCRDAAANQRGDARMGRLVGSAVVADESVADPDAMWKRGYHAPGLADADGSPEPDDEPRAWFASYGQTVTGLVAEAPEPTTGAPELTTEPPGPLAFDTATGDAPRRSRGVGARRRVVAGLTVGALAVVVGGVVWQDGRADDIESDDRLPSIPTEATPAWTAVLDTGGVNGVIGTRSTVVALESVTNDLVGLTATSGVERWRVNTAPSNSIATLERAGSAVIVRVERSTGERSVAAYDLESGERLWREDGFGRTSFTVFLGGIYRLPLGDTDLVVERLDPRTGAAINAVGSELLSSGWAHVATTRDGLVEVFDLQTLERVAGPVADGDMIAASVADGRVVGLGHDATVRIYGSTGDEQSSLQISIDQPDLFDVTNTSEPVLLVAADAAIVGYSLTGDRISEVWRMGPVVLNEITEVGDRTYIVMQTVAAAGANDAGVRIVDAATGDEVAQHSRESSVQLGNDGFVVGITDDDGEREAIEAYGYDGERRWQFDLAVDQQDLFLVDGAMVVVASDFVTDTSILTYLN
jgi:hypothetical protein